ncbi:MAG: hypothetical protein GF411_12135 [Candidatus Lokiarchaeota archaeon]|nr:hypothetical protein [Candidatus Lokiarchaeota archaeon]
MSSVRERPVSKRSAFRIFYILAIGSGVMRTFSVAFDVVALNTMFSDPLAFGFVSQWVSILVTFFLVLVLSFPKKVNGKKRSLGFSVDPDFGRISLLPRKPMLYIILAGIFAGISTYSYYLLVGASDASTMLPYGQLVIIYLLLGDLFAEKDTPTVIEIQCIISIMLGVLLVGVTPGGFDLPTLFIVLVPMNISSGLVTFYQRKTKRYEISPGLRVDSINMRLWTLLFLNITYSIFAIPTIPIGAWSLMADTFSSTFWFMVGSSLTTFFALVMYVRALGRGTMAVVNSLSSVSVVLGIPLTLIGNLFVPGAFGTIDADAFLWTIKIFGVILVMIGVVALEASDVRAIVLVRVKPQTGDILSELYDIKGIQRAAAIAGTYDYLLTVKSRSLAKTRTGILKKVQAIPEVYDVETLVILKEHR